MAHITEHHAEEEGEGCYTEDGGVRLQIRRHTVRVDNLLEDAGELVCLDKRWAADMVVLIYTYAHSP